MLRLSTVIGDQSVIEGRPLALNITATDNDGPAPLVIAANQHPAYRANPSVLTDNGNGTATLNWTPAVSATQRTGLTASR